MSDKRILLIGPNGQIGWELRRTLACLGEVIPAGRETRSRRLDLADLDQVRRQVRDSAPDLIVNAAAYTAVDQAETEPELANRINAEAPGVLAEEARRQGALLVHYSTDYVFNGEADCPYREDDTAEPINVYGASKLAGDRAIQAVDGDHLIFRTSWVYGARGRNFLLTMLQLGRERDQLCVVSDQIGAPTWARLIAEATALVLQSVQDGLDGRAGIYNLTCGGQTSWHGFATAIFAAARADYGLKTRQIDPILSSEYPTPAIRPAYSVLSQDKLAECFGIRLPNWQQALQLCLVDLADKP